MNDEHKNPRSPLDPGKTLGIEAKLRRVNPQVLGICHDAIADIYMSLVRGTVQATLHLAMSRVRAEQIRLDTEHERNPAMFPQRVFLKPPTRHLIQRLINEIPAFERHAARYGHMAAKIKFRSRQDNVQDKLSPPDLVAGQLYANSGRLYDRILTHKGIEFASILYNSAVFRDLRYREGAKLRVKVVIDEENHGRLWVISKGGEILEGRALRE